ncbi:S8 family serine peptidase [Actinospica sp. MGRD01-02]|uniref:S8 family serine peptidase n=1 Tax=Actinospica acidithermotolerans TaxID=2828514 RepID=A0A941E7S1_9ACTN|nr:S8 family serine peptidase [Actinospica acidithermotolerans]MBR7826641.1 S8 family serine peptidase [Actinospica acidithermotolerans]
MSGPLQQLVTDLERILTEDAGTASHGELADIPGRLEAVLDAIAAQPPLTEITECNRLAVLLDMCGYSGEAGRLLIATHEACQGFGPEQARVLNQRGMLAALRGDDEQAAELFEEALFTPSLQSPELRQILQTNLAEVALRRGDLVTANQWANRARAATPAVNSALLELVLARIAFQTARHRADRNAMATSVQALAAATRRRIGELDPHSIQALTLVGNLAAAQSDVAWSCGEIARIEVIIDALSVTALRLSAAVGGGDPRALEIYAAIAIAQSRLACNDGSPPRIDQAGQQLKSLYERVVAITDPRDVRMMTLTLDLAIARVELARTHDASTLSEATNDLRKMATRLEDALGPQSATTLEALANLAIADLEILRTSGTGELAVPAVARLNGIAERVDRGLGLHHPLAAKLNVALQRGRRSTAFRRVGDGGSAVRTEPVSATANLGNSSRRRALSRDTLERLLSRHPDAIFTDGAVHRRDQLLVAEHQSEHAREAVADYVERIDEYPEIGVHRLRLRASARVDVPELAANLRDQGIGATPNHLLRGEPSYGVPTLCAPVAAPVANGVGRKVTVAVLDTGITPHPWFTNTDWWSEVTPEQLDPVDAGCDYELDAQAGHGTFVAGVLLQKAPNARLWIDRLLDDIGVCDELELLHSLGRIRRREQATGTKVDIVNLSLGGYAHADHPSPLVADALRRFGSHTVVVTAAGNNGSDRPFWPAALKDCVAVGTKAPFSDRGWWVDASAPGVDVVGPFPQRRPDGEIELGYARWSGTSFAAPYVAGAIAHLANDKNITAREAAELLLDTARPKTDPDFGVEIG